MWGHTGQNESMLQPHHIGYAAMLERFHPSEAIALATEAEKHGFTGVMAADHFQPWTAAQGHASNAFNVLSAMGAATKGDLGTATTPGYRTHPAHTAQAAATLAAMYPQRAWLGIGSGEALNEHVVGQYWPEAPERIARMFEGVEVIAKLFTGKEVKHDGRYFKLESTRLWTMPEVAPPILVATSGPVTAKRAGRVADGLITEGGPLDKLESLIHRFEEGGGKGKPKVLRLHLSWAETDEIAQKNALAEWPIAGMRFGKSDIRSPFELEQLARLVRVDDFEGRMLISPDLDAHRANIQRHLDLGFDRVYLHNAGRDQREFLRVFGAEVLPALVR
jgi:coenzyme F420-dependent glucose-6-phosphate dehydrogenase